MREIQIANGKGVALVDDDDYEWLNQWKWYALKHKNLRYAVHDLWCNGKKKGILMHLLILPAPPGKEIDHRDGNGLKNVRSNLRVCTHAENCRNVKPHRDGTSKYKGVSWCKEKQKWTVHVKNKHIGRFVSEEDAARAYDVAAIDLFGEFARPNFPI